MDERIRRVLRAVARLDVDLDQLGDDDDLRAAGLKSLAMMNVMMALENEFDVAFPDRMLSRAVFSSVSSLRAAVTELLESRPAAR